MGIVPHLSQGTEIARRPIRLRQDKAEVIEEVLNFARRLRADTKFLFELRLILEETINNALFHAFHDDQQQERYNIESFTGLGPGEEVSVEFGADRQTIALAVTDNQGTLRRETILGKILRQCSAEGLLDQSGRGLHLVYSLAGRCLVHLSHRRVTQVVTLFPVDHDSWPHAGLQRPLVTTCSYCNKAICEKCLFYFEGMVYCGQPCAVEAKSMGVTLRAKLDRGRGFRGFIGWIVRTAILIAVILGLLDFFEINLPFVPHFF
jgi:anti-sigma regulatory factor (Ser/Thr protein kinase)